MKGILYILLVFTLISLPFGSVESKILSGNVNKEDYINKHKVIDINTGNSIPNAEVSIPSKGIFAKTDEFGGFSLQTSSDGAFILSVKADGYKPFSAIIEKGDLKEPLIVGITKQKINEIVIDSNIRHLGDNKFSNNSANASDFLVNSGGPYFFKEFYVGNILNKASGYLKIGSIIGIDTKAAKRLRQSRALVSSSSPVKIYLNSRKIGELKINGDNQSIPIPTELLREKAFNTIRIETGVNLNAKSHVDYDDIEFMNLILEFK